MSEEFASVEDLLADEVTDNTDTVQLPNGKKVVVRGMSRWELQQAGKDTNDAAVAEARMLAACILVPKMTYAQVVQMQKAKGPNGMVRVVTRMRELSGLAEGAAKSDVGGVRNSG